MNVRQHSSGRGECLGPEASGVVPMRFFSVGISITGTVDISPHGRLAKTESICA
jgi:hypothetical protein